jgi:predicted GH43/DUF377 family glycosyl hydrolase
MEIVRLANPTNLPHWLNGGIADAWGKRLMVYRLGRGSRTLGLSELVGNKLVGAHVVHTQQVDGFSEDPRIVFDGETLHCIYCATEGGARAGMRLATIDENYEIVTDVKCSIEGAKPVEKNWAPFACGKQLYAIYSTLPGYSLRYAGAGRWDVGNAPGLQHAQRLWNYGQIRGGANIVEHNGEFYHFFHSARGVNNIKIYYMGCYTFDKNFQVKRVTQMPLLSGDASEHTRPWGPTCGPVAACFPCGCIRDADNWLISYGWMDVEIRLAKIGFDELDGCLNPITDYPPKTIS